jgi:hypothetical protein
VPRFALLPLLCAAVSALVAQTGTNAAAPTIQANGTATVSMSPDQAQFTVGVTTQAGTATAAAQQNALQTTAVISAVQQALGPSGTIQTIGYSVTPQYSNGNQPAITGYTASNTLQVTLFNLASLPGRVIDAASQAGANNISGISFSLQNPDPELRQALTLATQQALAHATAIAAGLNAKAGPVVSAQEGGTVTPYVAAPTAGAAAGTPILTGTVTVSATVTIVVQMTQ